MKSIFGMLPKIKVFYTKTFEITGLLASQIKIKKFRLCEKSRDLENWYEYS